MQEKIFDFTTTSRYKRRFILACSNIEFQYLIVSKEAPLGAQRRNENKFSCCIWSSVRVSTCTILVCSSTVTKYARQEFIVQPPRKVEFLCYYVKVITYFTLKYTLGKIGRNYNVFSSAAAGKRKSCSNCICISFAHGLHSGSSAFRAFPQQGCTIAAIFKWNLT